MGYFDFKKLAAEEAMRSGWIEEGLTDDEILEQREHAKKVAAEQDAALASILNLKF